MLRIWGSKPESTAIMGVLPQFFKPSNRSRNARGPIRLEYEAWNAIIWAGGPAMPSPGERQAEPTIAKAINGGYDFLEAKCNCCDRVSLVPLRALKHPPDTAVWKLEAALYCEPCSNGRQYSRRQRAHILGLTYARPDPEAPRAVARKAK
jgi:hypothetical protein